MNPDREELKSRLRVAIKGERDRRNKPRIICLAKHASQHRDMLKEEWMEKTKERSAMMSAGFGYANRWTFVGDENKLTN